MLKSWFVGLGDVHVRNWLGYTLWMARIALSAREGRS